MSILFFRMDAGYSSNREHNRIPGLLSYTGINTQNLLVPARP